MNDLAFSVSTETKRWDRLRAEVHAWRGEMIDIFARAEAAVGETLHAAGRQGQSLHLAGMKYKVMAELVAEGGPLVGVGKHVAGELAAFRVFDELRSTLCHGALLVTVDAADA